MSKILKRIKKTSIFILIPALILISAIDRVQPEFLLNAEPARSIQEKQKYHYVGIEKCASVCHNNEEMGFQYNIMKNGPHSQAFNVLASKKALRYAKNDNIKENPQQSSVCLKCHVTGGGLDSSLTSWGNMQK